MRLYCSEKPNLMVYKSAQLCLRNAAARQSVTNGFARFIDYTVVSGAVSRESLKLSYNRKSAHVLKFRQSCDTGLIYPFPNLLQLLVLEPNCFGHFQN